MTTKPQSDADVAREILDKCVNVFRGHMIDSYNYEKATDLIAQHVAARAKPLVEALIDVLHLASYDTLHPSGAILGDDAQEIRRVIRKALAQEKGRSDGN